jgi:hypothetical protein
MILICLLFSSPVISHAVTNDFTRPMYDDGSSTGGGGSSVQKTNKALLDVVKALFSGSTSPKTSTGSPNKNNNSTNTNNSTSTGNDSTTYTPPPNIASAGELQFADNIAKLIQDDCTNEGVGVVTKKNTVSSQMFLKKPSCITRSSVSLKNGTVEFTNSVTAFYYLQCVACARALAAARGRPYNGFGAAKEHIGQQVSGYTYFSNKSQNYNQLVPGSVGIANEGTYGHIFYITDVIKNTNGTPKAFKALECNWGAQGLLRHDKTRPVDGYMSGWQRPNSL